MADRFDWLFLLSFWLLWSSLTKGIVIRLVDEKHGVFWNFVVWFGFLLFFHVNRIEKLLWLEFILGYVFVLIFMIFREGKQFFIKCFRILYIIVCDLRVFLVRHLYLISGKFETFHMNSRAGGEIGKSLLFNQVFINFKGCGIKRIDFVLFFHYEESYW